MSSRRVLHRAAVVLVLLVCAALLLGCGPEAPPRNPTASAVPAPPTPTQVQTTPPTAPTPSPTPSATSGQATQESPSLPMDHVGRTVEVCAACHGPAGEKPTLATHAGRPAASCTECHTCEGCHISKPRTD